MWRLWQGWQYISIESLFPKIWSFEDICGSSGMLENRPTHQLLKCYSQPVVSCGICGRDGNTFQLSLSFQICFEDPSGSPGMLENRLAHQILLSVSQYCLTFGFPGGQHFYIASFFQEFSQRFVKISGSPGLLDNTATPEIPPMSVRLYSPVAFMAAVATHFNCFFHSKIVEDTLGSPGMLENTTIPDIPQMSVC